MGTVLHFLPPGKMLRQYKILKILGSGGFGITYQVRDETLEKLFAVKEHFPEGIVFRSGVTLKAKTGSVEDFKIAKSLFLKEAELLARFNDRNIAEVVQVFEANGTAYMVQKYEAGRDLKSWFEEIGDAPTQLELDCILEPLLRALEIVHRNDLLHRDIAPDNIIIRDDGSPVLIDFGSAKDALSQHTKSVAAIVKSGYSPPELYSSRGRGQGPWSDIYSFAATLYRAVTGEQPDEATERLISENVVSARVKSKGGYRTSFLDAIDWGMRVAPGDRPQSIAEWRRALFLEGEPVQVTLLEQPIELKAETRAHSAPATSQASEQSGEKTSVSSDEEAVPRAPDGSASKGAAKSKNESSRLFYAVIGIFLAVGIAAGLWDPIATFVASLIKQERRDASRSEVAGGRMGMRGQEAAEFSSAAGEEGRLKRYIETCKICEYKDEAALQIARIKFSANEKIRVAGLEAENYRAARGDAARLRRYLAECKICEYKTRATVDIQKIEETLAYRSARGNSSRLRTYLNECQLCEDGANALAELELLLKQDRKREAATEVAFPTVDFWESKGSVLNLVTSSSDPNLRTFTYKSPSRAAQRDGVKEGDLLFEGRRVGLEYKGTSYRYSRHCGRRPFLVSGVVSANERTVTLSGSAPVRDTSCTVVRFEEATLDLVFHDREDNWGRGAR